MISYKNIKKLFFFFWKLPAVEIGEDREEGDDEEESLDATVVDTEEVNVHNKLLCM